MRFYTMAVMGLALGVLALAVPTAVRAAPIVVGNLDVDYGVSMPGTTFHLSNLSDAPISQLSLSTSGYSGSIIGLTGDQQPGGNSFSVQPGETFSFGYQPNNPGLQQPFTGNAGFTFTALWNSQTLFAFFSPDQNATSGFVGFLGNGADGQPLNGTVPRITVAMLKGDPSLNPGTGPTKPGGSTGTPGTSDPDPSTPEEPDPGETTPPPAPQTDPTVTTAPEPSALVLSGLGALGLLRFAYRRRRTANGTV